jgi:hypothetical protein
MKTRLKLSLLLTPAVFLLVVWSIFLSSSALVASIEGASKMLAWGLLLSFGVSLAITMYLCELLSKIGWKQN